MRLEDEAMVSVDDLLLTVNIRQEVHTGVMKLLQVYPHFTYTALPYSYAYYRRKAK